MEAAGGFDQPARGRDEMTGINNLITGVKAMDLPSLRDEWQRHHRTPPPRHLSRDLLIRGISYTLQAQAQGGLSKATRRRLQTLADTFARTGRITPENATRVRPGAQLVREWQDRTYTITVTEGGFDYDGETYDSLTAIAQRITGAHWSGPRFFGLKGKAVHG